MMMDVTFVLPEKLFSGAKLCCRLFIIVWDFLPSSGSSFSLAFFGVEMFCLLLSVTLVSRIRLARIQGWLRGEDKDEDTSLGILVGQKQGQEGRARLWAEQSLY